MKSSKCRRSSSARPSGPKKVVISPPLASLAPGRRGACGWPGGGGGQPAGTGKEGSKVGKGKGSEFTHPLVHPGALGEELMTARNALARAWARKSARGQGPAPEPGARHVADAAQAAPQRARHGRELGPGDHGVGVLVQHGKHRRDVLALARVSACASARQGGGRQGACSSDVCQARTSGRIARKDMTSKNSS